MKIVHTTPRKNMQNTQNIKEQRKKTKVTVYKFN